MRLEEFKRKIMSVSDGNLPADSAHLEMTPYKRGLSVKPEAPRLSAVMVLAYEKDDVAEILLLKRAEYGGVHSAQISFPGGKKDDADADLLSTAIRELEEETGVTADNIEILCPVSTMFIPPSNFLVHPFVAVCKGELCVNLDERESQYHFGGKVAELLDDAYLRTTDIRASYGNIKNVPYFHLNNEIVWGATAAILNEMKMILR